MAIDTTVFQARVQSTITALPSPAPAKDLLLLGKAIEAVAGSIAVSDVQAAGATQITAIGTEATARLSAITTAGATQVSAVNSAGDAKIAQIQSSGGTGTSDPTLNGISALTLATDQGFYATGAHTFAPYALSPYARTLLDDVDGPTMLGTLGVTPAARAILDDASSTAILATLGVTLGAAGGNVPVLDGTGKLLTSVLPGLAITDVSVVASQTAMLALTAQRGDIAIRSDLNKSFALSTDDPTVLANWKELLTPTDAVLSVAGQTGAITAAALKTALTIAAADITDAGATGRTLLQAANVAAAKTALTYVAGDVGFTPTGNIAATTVAAALAELDAEKQAALTMAAAASVWAGTNNTDPLTSKSAADAEAIQSTTGSGTWAPNLSTGGINLQRIASGASTVAPTGGIAGRTYALLLTQDATGSRTWAFNASIDFGSAGTPTPSTAASKTDILFLYCLASGSYRASFNKAA